MRKTLLIIFSFAYLVCHSQELNVVYYAVSSDSLHTDHQLELKNDTLLEISTFPSQKLRQLKVIFNYKKLNGTLNIYKEEQELSDSLALIKNGLTQFNSIVTVIIDKKALVDEQNNLVYVLYHDFEDKFYITYLIDGKIYKQESGLPDADGLIKHNNPKNNKKLQDKLEALKNELQNHQIKRYKGLDAYKKFGYESVFGVIELTRLK